MASRRVSRALGAFLVVLWAAAFEALLNLTTDPFDLSPFRWWLVGAAIAGSVGSGLTVGFARYGALRGPAALLWQIPQPDAQALERPELANAITKLLLTRQPNTVAVTTALFGAGGFGKTTLARQVCWSRVVRRRFRGGALWVTIGDLPSGRQLLDKVNDICIKLGADGPPMSDLEQAGLRLGQLLDERRDFLLVVDDVWRAEHLRPFLEGGQTCTRLVTTRRPGVLSAVTSRHGSIKVDRLTDVQTRAMLTAGLPAPSPTDGAELLRLTGRWPLLVRLANRRLTADVDSGVPAPEAYARLIARLKEEGPGQLDILSEASRDHAAAASINASLAFLPASERRLATQLAIFPEDAEIPREVLALLWSATGDLSRTQVEDLCDALNGLSLLSDYDRSSGAVALHDVVRAHLRRLLSTELASINGLLISAARSLVPVEHHAGIGPMQAWWRLPADADYLWRNLCTHLSDAGRAAELATLVCDLRWVEAKIRCFSANALDDDLSKTDDPVAKVLRKALHQCSHLLLPIEPKHALAGIIVSRLDDIAELRSIVDSYISTRQPALHLSNRWPLPDRPTGALVRVLTGHTHRLTCCAVAPDGSWIVTGSWDNTARIWETATGSVRCILPGHTRDLADCAIAADGTWLATVGNDGAARVWDAATGTVRFTLTGPRPAELFRERLLDKLVNVFSKPDALEGAMLRTCAIAPDSSWLITAGWDSTAWIWDAATGQLRHTLTSHSGPITSCKIAPNGEWLVTTSEDFTARIWDASTGRLLRILKGHTNQIVACMIAPDGSWLVTGSWDGTARIWDAATAGLRHVLPHDETDDESRSVQDCVITPNGEQVVTVGANGLTRIWGTEDGRLLHTFGEHEHWVTACVVSPDGTWLATASDDESARIWDLATGGLRSILTGHNAPVRICVATPDSQRLITVAEENTARIWDPTQMAAPDISSHSRAYAVKACAVAATEPWLAAPGPWGTIRLWDTATGLSVGILDPEHRTGIDNDIVAIAPDSRWLATKGVNDVVVFTAPAGPIRHRLSAYRPSYPVGETSTYQDTEGAPGTANPDQEKTTDDETKFDSYSIVHRDFGVEECAISPDSKQLVTAGVGVACLWDMTTGQLRRVLGDPAPEYSLGYWDTGHTSNKVSCQFAADGSWLITTSWDGNARIWNAAGTLLHVLTGHTHSVIGCAISPDCTWAVTTSNDRTARIWNADGTLRHILTGHTDAVVGCVIAPDNSFLATISWDHTARIWNPERGEVIQTISGHSGPVVTCAVTPAEGWLITGSHDGTVRIWNATKGQPLAAMRLGGRVNHLAVLPDGTGICVATSAGIYGLDIQMYPLGQHLFPQSTSDSRPPQLPRQSS